MLQLPLMFNLREEATLANFCWQGNQALENSLANFVDGSNPTNNFIYIWGKGFSGRSHILHAVCQEMESKKLSSIYLPLAQLVTMDCGFCEGLDLVDVVCIDDVDLVAGHRQWEQALFNLYNRLQAKAKRLLVTSSLPAVQLTTMLADLRSRLSAGLCYQLHELDDDGKLILLQNRAGLRGLELSDAVAKFLLSRSSRNIQDLFVQLDVLDKASLSNQRRLTLPFVKQTLNL